MNAQEIIEKIRAEINLLMQGEQQEIKDMEGALVPNLRSYTKGKRDAFIDTLIVLDKLKELSITRDFNFDDEVVKWIQEHSDVDGSYSGIDFARHFYELGRHSKEEDVIIQKARTEKQRVLVTETDGNANVFWDARSLDDVKALLLCGLDFIKKQSKEQPVCDGLEDELVKYIGYPEENLDGKWKKKEVEEIARHFAQWQKEQMMKEAVEGEIINAGYPTKIELNTFYSKFEHGQKVKLIIIKED